MINEEQLAAAGSSAAETYVVAGPGSGKTTTLVHRIESIDARNATVLTFTNKAARELRKRIDPDLKPRFVGTLHRFALETVRRSWAPIGFGTEPILVPTESDFLIAAQVSLNYKVVPKAAIATEWNRSIYWPDEPIGHRKAALIVRTAQIEMMHQAVMSYDTMLCHAHKLIKFESMSGMQPDAPQHLLVDEAQDSSPIDWAIYDAIRADFKWFCGDPDQSIYEFRGAMPQTFIERAQSPTVKRVNLELNYRSDAEIASHANRVIRKNTSRLDKMIIPLSVNAGKVTHIECQTFQEEIAISLTAAKSAVANGYTHATLCRTNREANEVREAMELAGIKVGRERRRPMNWEDMLTRVNFACNPDNDHAAAKYLGLTEPDSMVDIVAKAAVALKSVNAHHFNVKPYEHVLQLANMLRRAMEETAASMIEGCATLTEALAMLNSYDGEAQTEDAVVSAITIHKAKGLEFDSVHIPGLVQSSFPRGTNTEEERRLFFVALTRARHEVVLSNHTRRVNPFRIGQIENVNQSIFIRDARRRVLGG